MQRKAFLYLAGGAAFGKAKLAHKERVDREQWKAAASAAGPRFLLSPGCSVPDNSSPEELGRLPKVLGG